MAYPVSAAHQALLACCSSPLSPAHSGPRINTQHLSNPPTPHNPWPRSDLASDLPRCRRLELGAYLGHKRHLVRRPESASSAATGCDLVPQCRDTGCDRVCGALMHTLSDMRDAGSRIICCADVRLLPHHNHAVFPPALRLDRLPLAADGMSKLCRTDSRTAGPSRCGTMGEMPSCRRRPSTM